MSVKPIKWVQIEVSTLCPLKCVMCPKSSFIDQWDSGNMSIEIFNAILLDLDKVEYAHLQGWGEPLCHPKILEMVKKASERTFVGLTTNGELLNERRAKELIEAGINTITFSLAGATEKTHSSIRIGSQLSRVCDGIKAILNARKGFEKPSINVTFLMTKGNIHELPNMVEISHKLKVDTLIVTNLDYVATEEHDLIKVFSCDGVNKTVESIIDEAELKAKKLGLNIELRRTIFEEAHVCAENPDKCLFVNFQGYVSPCVQLSVPIKGDFIPRIFCGKKLMIKKLFFGNIKEKSLMEIWESDEYKRFRDVFSKRRELKRFYEKPFIMEISLSTLLEYEEKLKRIPLPEPCKTCYKAYSI